MPIALLCWVLRSNGIALLLSQTDNTGVLQLKPRLDI